MDIKNNYFQQLNTLNVGDHIEKKNGLSYLSWAWAWAEVKKLCPETTYTVYENNDGWNYFTDGKTCWVKTGVTVNGIEHIEYLPVMDFKNKSIPLNAVTSFDVNKAIQRSLTKAVARHGLGLYIYAGEDLPEDDDEPEVKEPPKKTSKAAPKTAPKAEGGLTCENCGKIVLEAKRKDGSAIPIETIVAESRKRFNKCYCSSCLSKEIKNLKENKNA